MKIFRKRILPKIWLSAFAIGILFLSFVGATVKASDNQETQKLTGFSFAALSENIFGSSFFTANNAILAGETFQFVPQSYDQPEGDETNGPTFVSLTVTRTGGTLAATQTVQYTTSNGTATAAVGATCNQIFDPTQDFIQTTGTLTFAPGVSTQTFQVQICGDDVFEGNESFNVILFNPAGPAGEAPLLGSPATATVNIIDDDAASAGQFSIQQGVTVNENTPGFVDITITRNGADVASSVTATTSTGTQQNPLPGTATGGASCADPGVDFVNRSAPVDFAAGQTAQTFRVQICDDNFFEDNETFTVTLSLNQNSNGATINNAASSTLVTIIDNDNNTPGTLAFNTVSRTVRVPERSDAAPAGNVTVTLGVTRTGGASGAITASYTVISTSPSGAVGTTAQGCNNGTPNNPFDDFDVLAPANTTNVIQFASGSSTQQTITLTICNDALDEPLFEDFQVILGNPQTAPDPNAFPVQFDPVNRTANLRILDGENGTFAFTTSPTAPAGATITGSTTGNDPISTLNLASIPENQGFYEVTVFRVNPGQPLIGAATVDYTVESAAGQTATIGASCAANIDVAVTPGAVTGTLTFGQGISSQSFQIQICDDSVFEQGNTGTTTVNNETFRVRLSNPQLVAPAFPGDRPLLGNEGTFNSFDNQPSGGTTFQTITGVSPLPTLLNLNITENDPANFGVVTISNGNPPSRGEGEVPATIVFTVTRTSGDGNINVPITFGGTATRSTNACATGDYTSNATSVTFANGVTTQTVTLTVCDDATFEGTESVVLTLGTPGTISNTPAGSTQASIGAANSGTANILDNDANAGTVSIPATPPGTNPNTGALPEFVGTVAITVTRANGANGAINVPYYFTNTSPNGFPVAIGGTSCTNQAGPGAIDYINPNNSSAANPNFVFFGDTQTTATINVTICNDTEDEVDFEEFQLVLGPQAAVIGGGTISATSNTTTFRIQDDENGVVQFGPFDQGPNIFTAPEGNAGVTTKAITVSRNNTAQQVTVQATVTGGTATAGTCGVAGADYVNPGVQTLVFNQGVSQQTFLVQICGDTFDEPDFETVLFALTPVGNNVVIGNASTAELRILDDDATPTFTINNPTVTEGNAGQTNLAFTITLTGQTNQATSITATTVAGGTATAGPAAAGCTPGVDYLTTTQTFPIAASANATQTVTFNVPVCGDVLDELNETVFVSLSGAVNATIPANTQGVGTITDDDATPTLTINSVTQAEGNSGTTNFVFTVTSSATSGLAQNFTYSVVPGTTNPATPGTACTVAGTDFIAPAANTAATIPVGSSTFTITVPVCGDTINEADETFFVQLNSVTGGGNTTIPAGTQGVGTITNDDAAPTLTISNVTQAEGNSGTTNFVFTVTSSAVTQQNVTFNYSVVPGTPNPATGGAACTTAGVDFVQPAANQPLTIAAGQTTATITVAVCGDTLDELNETFFVNLSSAVNATIPANTQGVGTITDDDATPTLAITNVTQAEGNGPGVTNFVFSVTPSAASGQQITVNYTTAPTGANPATAGAPGQCTAGADFQTTSGTLTFTAGSAAAQTITVPVCGDTIDELDETFVVFLTGAVNATLPANTQGLGTIQDDDAGPGSVTSTSSLTTPTRVLEGNTGTQTVTFTFTNNNPNPNPATVNFTTSGGTATAGASCATAGVDYVTQTGTLTFAANSTGPQTVTVTVCGDTRKEANETFFINLSGAVNTTIGANTQGVGIIIDDDRAIRADFDIDRRTDLSVFRPSNGFWYILQSVNGLLRAQQFGAAGDIPVPGDYDGDRSTDLAFFRPSTSTWNIYQSTSNSVVTIAFGSTGDIPVQGDYNGDGVTEVAVFRPSTGTFFTSQDPATNFGAIQFGANGDVPVPADYDGDGRTDVAVFRPGTTNATWFVRNSSSGANFGISYGAPTDIPVTGDIDGDGKSDFTVFRTGAAGNPPGVVGAFYTFQSLTQSSTGVAFGQAGDIPSIGDYDGDGTDDISVYRPNSTNGTGTFFFLRSTAGFGGAQFGANTDIPIPSRYQAYRPTQTPLL